MTYHRMFNMSNTTGTTSTAVMAYPSGASSSHSVSSGVRVAEFSVLCVVFRRSLFGRISFWFLYCLFYFDLRLLIIPLISPTIFLTVIRPYLLMSVRD
jgi:hypothetical protein